MRASAIILSLIEGRLEFLQQKYGSQVNPGVFRMLIAADPTSRANQPGNYTEWIIRHYLKSPDQSTYLEDLQRLRGDLEIYHAFKPRMQPEQRDINRFNPQQLFKVIEPFIGKPKDQSEMVAHGVETVYKDENVVCLWVKTYEAMVKLGRGTRWCVAADSRNGCNHYRSYTDDGRLILIHFKDGARYLFHDSKRDNLQFMDINDHPAQLPEVLSHHPEPEEFRRWLAKHTVVRMHAVSQGLYHEYHDKPIEQDPDSRIRAQVARVSQTPVNVVRSLVHDPSEEVRIALAQTRKEPEIITTLLRDRFGSVRYAALSQAARVGIELPPETIAKLAADQSPIIRAMIAKDPKTPPEFLENLSNDPEWNVREEIAKNRSTPPQVLQNLSNDPDWKIRLRIAKNESTPRQVLANMVSDENYWVQKELVHRNDPELLALLAKSDLARIRMAVSENPNTPPDVIKSIIRDKHAAAGAAKNTADKFDMELFRELANNKNPQLRAKAARNLDAPSSELARLSADPEAVVRKEAAANPSTPPTALIRLMADDNPNVRMNVAKNKGATPETLHRLYAEEVSRASKDKFVIINIGANPRTPQDILQTLGADADLWIRKAVASNPRTPPELLQRLANDPIFMVKQTAKSTMAK